MVQLREVNDTRDAAVISFTAEFDTKSGSSSRSFVYLLVVRNNNNYTWKGIKDYMTVTPDILKQYGFYEAAEKLKSRRR